MPTILSLLCLLFATESFGGLTYGTYNIRNFDYDERSGTPTNKRHLINTLKSMDADLLAVQEINEAYTFKRMIENNFGDRLKTILSNCGGTHGQKLGFVYNSHKLKLVNFSEDMRTVDPNNPRQSFCKGSRPLAVAIFQEVTSGKSIIAIAVHLKSGGRPKHIAKRFKQIDSLTMAVKRYKRLGHKNFVVMGDFNSTEYIFKKGRHKVFDQKVQQMGLKDISQNLKCTAYWWGSKDDDKQYPSHLDHILLSHSLMPKKQLKAKALGHCAKLQCQSSFESSMGVDFTEVSDHCPIIAHSN